MNPRSNESKSKEPTTRTTSSERKRVPVPQSLREFVGLDGLAPGVKDVTDKNKVTDEEEVPDVREAMEGELAERYGEKVYYEKGWGFKAIPEALETDLALDEYAQDLPRIRNKSCNDSPLIKNIEGVLERSRVKSAPEEYADEEVQITFSTNRTRTLTLSDSLQQRTQEFLGDSLSDFDDLDKDGIVLGQFQSCYMELSIASLEATICFILLLMLGSRSIFICFVPIYTIITEHSRSSSR